MNITLTLGQTAALIASSALGAIGSMCWLLKKAIDRGDPDPGGSCLATLLTLGFWIPAIAILIGVFAS